MPIKVLVEFYILCETKEYPICLSKIRQESVIVQASKNVKPASIAGLGFHMVLGNKHLLLL